MKQCKPLLTFLIILSCTIATKNLHSRKSDRSVWRSDWKQTTTKEFNSNCMALQKIIMDAENPSQITDFSDKFKKQKDWFNKTLHSSKSAPSDLNKDKFYKKIVAKNSRLDFIATSIKKSENILEKLELTANQKKLIRLKLLYEINAMAGQEQSLSDQKLRSLTISVIENVVGEKITDFPELKLAQIQFTDKIETIGQEMFDLQITNKELLNKIDSDQKTVADMKVFISKLKNHAQESSNKTKLTEQICDTTLTEQANLFKTELMNIEEQKNREEIDLEILKMEALNNFNHN